MSQASAGLAAALLLTAVSQPVHACVVGPYTLDFADPGASPRSNDRLHYFIGEVVDIRALSEGRSQVTFKVLRDYVYDPRSKLGAEISVVTSLGGCGAGLETKQVGKFGLMVYNNGKLSLVATRWNF